MIQGQQKSTNKMKQFIFYENASAPSSFQYFSSNTSLKSINYRSISQLSRLAEYL